MRTVVVTDTARADAEDEWALLADVVGVPFERVALTDRTFLAPRFEDVRELQEGLEARLRAHRPQVILVAGPVAAGLLLNGLTAAVDARSIGEGAPNLLAFRPKLVVLAQSPRTFSLPRVGGPFYVVFVPFPKLPVTTTDRFVLDGVRTQLRLWAPAPQRFEEEPLFDDCPPPPPLPVTAPTFEEVRATYPEALEFLLLDCECVDGEVRLHGRSTLGHSVLFAAKDFVPEAYVAVGAEHPDDYVAHHMAVNGVREWERCRRNVFGTGGAARHTDMVRMRLHSPLTLPALEHKADLFNAHIAPEIQLLVERRLWIGSLCRVDMWRAALCAQTVEGRAWVRLRGPPDALAPADRTDDELQDLFRRHVRVLALGVTVCATEPRLVSHVTMRVRGRTHLLTLGGPGDRVYGLESELLRDAARLLAEEDPDVLVGYRLTTHALPALTARARAHGIPLLTGRGGGARGRALVDLYGTEDKHANAPPKFSTLSRQVLGRAVKNPETVHEDYLRFRVGREEVAARCRAYVEAVAEIEAATDRAANLYELARVMALVPLPQVETLGRPTCVERCAYRWNATHFGGRFVFRRPQKDDETYQGGLVVSPGAALYDQPIVECDFEKQYPSIIEYLNASPETLTLCETLPEARRGRVLLGDARYCYLAEREHKGLFPTILHHLRAARDALRGTADRRPGLRAREQALKLFMNVFSGFLGYRYSAIAGDMTAVGRQLIEQARDVFERRGMRVVFGDTDSVFVTRGPAFADALDELNGALPRPIRLEAKRTLRGMLTIKGKEYAALEGDRVVVSSLRLDRRSCPAFAARVQMGVLQLLFSRTPDKARVVRDFLESVLARARDAPVSDWVVTERLSPQGSAARAALGAVKLYRSLAAARDPRCPHLGGYISFVHALGADGSPVCALARDVRAGRARLDLPYNLDHYVKRPCLSYLAVLFPGAGAEPFFGFLPGLLRGTVRPVADVDTDSDFWVPGSPLYECSACGRLYETAIQECGCAPA